MTIDDVVEMFPKCSRCGWPLDASKGEVEIDPRNEHRAAHTLCTLFDFTAQDFIDYPHLRSA